MLLNKNNERAYQGYQEWKGWHTFFSPTAQECELFLEEFKNISLAQKSILDIGFGSGSLLAWMKSVGGNVAGVEIQSNLLEVAQKQGITVFKDIADAPSGYYDIISLFDVLEHLTSDEIQIILLEAYRVAHSGCTIIIRVPNCQSPAGLANQFADPTHISMLSGPIVKAFLQQANFQEILVREAHLQPSSIPLNRILRKLATPIINAFKSLYMLTWSVRLTPLSSNVIIVATKNC
jgi:2-polyprenyl-3-methyl-5-hydroxy-6-metoxy-1,4-benzoquinol methylase